MSAVPTAFRPPQVGQAFTFEVEVNRDGKKRSANLGVPLPRKTVERVRDVPAVAFNPASLIAIPLFLAIFVAVAVLWRVSVWVGVGYLALSVAAVIAYAADKSAARSGAWRSSEQSLLLLGLAGGWPSAIVAQQVLRHKNRKVSFQLAFWGTVFLNVAAFIVYHSPLATSWRS